MASSEDTKHKDIVKKLREFVNTPTPTNSADYAQVCQTLLDKIEITDIFASLIVCPQSFKTISTAILKLFSSDIGRSLLRNEDVLKWLVTGLQQSSNREYEALNTLSIHVLHCALQSDKEVAFWITHDKSALFLWSLSLISSPFEASFQKLEQIIIKHGSHPLLVKTLFSANVIELLLNIKDQNQNEDVNKADKGTMRFRAHALWIDALNSLYNDDDDNDSEMKDNDKEEDAMHLYIENGLFSNLLQLLETDDVLIQINVLPLLSTLSRFGAGLQLLLKHKVVHLLVELLRREDAMLFGKEVYKVLVNMIRNTKTMQNEWLNDRELFEMIKLGFASSDASVKESCCLFVGFFCSFTNIVQKMIVLSESSASYIPSNTLCDFVNDLKTNPCAENQALAVAAIHGLCQIFALKTEDKSRIYSFQNGLLNRLCGMQKLYELLKHPNDQMRFSVFRLINSLCQQDWGVVLLRDCAGLFEYLTDRNDPDIMLAFQWKYTVLESIFKNKNTKQVLNQTHQEQLKKYIQQGVVFQSKEKKKKNQENVVQLGWEQY